MAPRVSSGTAECRPSRDRARPRHGQQRRRARCRRSCVAARWLRSNGPARIRRARPTRTAAPAEARPRSRRDRPHPRPRRGPAQTRRRPARRHSVRGPAPGRVVDRAATPAPRDRENRPEECRPYPRRSIPPTPRGAPARPRCRSRGCVRAPAASGRCACAAGAETRCRRRSDRSRSPARRLRGEGRTRQARPAVRILFAGRALAPVNESYTRYDRSSCGGNNSSTRSRRWQTPCSWA